MPLRILQEMFIIIRKNTLLDLKSPLALISEFLLPLQVCGLLYLTHRFEDSIVGIFLKMLLPFYFGNMNGSTIRKFCVYFINEREEHFRTYQLVLGLSRSGYILGNLMYMYCFTSMILTPVFITMMYYEANWRLVFYFAAFVLSSCNLILLLISFFRDPKIATEVISMIYSISFFSYYSIDLVNLNWISYILMMLPQPSFATALVQDEHLPGTMMLVSAKLTIVFFLWLEYGIVPLGGCISAIKRLRTTSSSPMSQEFEMQSLDSQARVQQPLIINKARLCQLKGVTKQYGQQKALDNISLGIYQGEILALLGRNGAGKTTLIDVLTRMEKPTSGMIDLNENIQMGVCYQFEILYNELTVEETIQFYIRVKRTAQTEMDRVLGEVGLLEEKNKKTMDLSGGMKRRLSVAIAIIGDPQLLIFDEPTSGLDPHSRRSVWEILKNLKHRNKTLLLTTHHLDEAQSLSDRVVIIERGTFLVIGSPNFIKKKFGIGYNLTIYGPIQTRRTHHKIIQKYVKVQEDFPDEHTTKYILRLKDEHNFHKIIKQLQDIDNIQVALQLNSLEEAFLSILSDPEIIGSDHIDLGLQNDIRSDMAEKRQLTAMLTKNLFIIKSNPFRSVMMYFLNITFVLLGTVLNKLMTDIAKEQGLGNSDQSSALPPTPLPDTGDIMKKVMMMQGYYMSVGIYVTIAVYQREKKIIDVLRVRGLNWWNYWLANFIIDFTFFNLNLMVLQYFVGDLNFVYMDFFGASMILYSYCCSYYFKTVKGAISYFPILNFLFGSFIPLVGFMETQWLKNSLTWILTRLYPFYDLQSQLLPNPTKPTVHSQPNYHYFLVQIVFYISVIACVELNVYRRIFKKQPHSTCPQNVRLEEVSKSYGEEQALKRVSFSVSDGEILGLLGPNGAGKSTTFKLLTNQETPTLGRLFLEGKIHQPFAYSFKSTGICYQDDTLWEKLSARQILKIFGQLVGVKNTKIESDWLFDHLEMQNTNRDFANLSGGNKRKCCMAVCLIGRPTSKYLDECSTGLDPMSRKSMVRVLSMEENTTVVFTTHSMNEAQAICTKIAILIKGELRELATLKQLKDKYYPSFFVDIIYNEKYDNIVSTLKQTIGEFEERQFDEAEKHIKIVVNKENIKLSQLFGKVMELKENNSIKDFSVYEPNLEDVYLKITADT